MCDHFHEATSRYDRDSRLLTLLLVCPVCAIEKVVETIEYEPRFRPCAIPGGKRSSDPQSITAQPLALAA
jgi:hypothetical protein